MKRIHNDSDQYFTKTSPGESTLLEKQKTIFRDALNDDNMYKKSVDTFLKGQPKAWEMIVRAMLALEIKNWVICGG